MDERLELLVMDVKAGRYARRQFIGKALELGVGIEASGRVVDPPGSGGKVR